MLPKDDDKPVLVWLPIEHDDDEDDEYVTEASVGFSDELGVPTHDRKIGLVMPTADNTMLGAGSPKEEYVTVVCGKRGAGALLDHSIVMMMRENQESSRPNQCFNHLTGEVGIRFCGPIVLLRQSKVENPIFTSDITAGDFTLGLDGTADYDMQANGTTNTIDTRRKLLGVKVSSNPQHVEKVEVPVRHPAF